MVAWVSSSAMGMPAVEHLEQRGVVALDGEKRTRAQVAQDPALIVGALVQPFQRPAGPQAGTQGAVPGHRRGRAQAELRWR